MLLLADVAKGCCTIKWNCCERRHGCQTSQGETWRCKLASLLEKMSLVDVTGGDIAPCDGNIWGETLLADVAERDDAP